MKSRIMYIEPKRAGLAQVPTPFDELIYEIQDLPEHMEMLPVQSGADAPQTM